MGDKKSGWKVLVGQWQREGSIFSYRNDWRPVMSIPEELPHGKEPSLPYVTSLTITSNSDWFETSRAL